MKRGRAQRLFPKGAFRTQRVVLVAFLGWVLLSGCAAPVGVDKIPSNRAQRDMTHTVLSNGEISERARILLRRTNTESQWKSDQAGALETLHRMIIADPGNTLNAERRIRILDGLSELAFAHAIDTNDRSYYLAAVLYAWIYLYPGELRSPPNALDRGVRHAADLYNRGLTLALTDPESGEVVLRDGEYPLPFGSLQIDFKEESLIWGDRTLTRFDSLADLRVKGLNNRYRMSGLGAPLGARVSKPTESRDSGEDMVFDGVRVPVTAILRFDTSQMKPEGGRYVATLSVMDHTTESSIEIDGQNVPLESEPSAALALQLTEAPPWQREIKGFFQGDLAQGKLGLATLAPYQRGRIPLVLVHGTASSAGRWADMVNDLMSEPALRENYQVWFFSYNTGGPIAYSAWLLRDAIARLVERFDPDETDRALRSQVVLGHSQGGLLAKLLVVDAGDQFWNLAINQSPEQVELEPENRVVLEGSLLVTPLPYVRNVIFLSTPHRGSRLANFGITRLMARFVRSPANVVSALGDLLANDPAVDAQRAIGEAAGSVGNMSPNSNFIQALAAMPVAPGVSSHSIMGVRTEPIEDGGDGVVSYKSAHLDDVDSELVVDSGHSSQANPFVIEEVRRILIENLGRKVVREEVAHEEAPMFAP